LSSRQSRDIRRRSRAIIWTIRRIRREAWLHFRLDIGLHLFELAADFWLHEMRELARAGLREMDPSPARSRTVWPLMSGPEALYCPASSAKASHMSM